MIITGGNNTGNFSIGDNNTQNNYQTPAAERVSQLIEQIAGLLQTQAGLRDSQEASSALDELSDAIEEDPAPAHPNRIRAAVARLKKGIGEVAAFTLPLAELAAAIDDLVRAKP